MYANKKKNNFSKVVVLLLCLSLLVGGVIGGTIAYLMTDTDPVVNTFVAGDIGDLELNEESVRNFIVTPGVDLTKDPIVTFSGNTVDALVFLKVDATGWEVDADHKVYGCVNPEGENLVTWTIGDGWQYVLSDENSHVYYQKVEAGKSLNAQAIKDNTITVDEDITKEDLEDFPEVSTLTFSAYAIQQAKTESSDFTAAEAWDALNP